MLYLSSFFGRTVSNVDVKSEITLKFSDFALVFPKIIRGNTDTFETLIGQKFLYIQRQKDAVYFHFSSAQYITFPFNVSGDKKIRLVNKEKESVLKLDDEREFENI
jgi:hypothetical protein